MLPPALILMLLTSLEGGGADVKLLPVRGVGLEQATLDAARTRVLDELKLMGLEVTEQDTAPEPACLADPVCAGELSGDSAGVIDVEMVRFGPELIITARFFDRAGEAKASAERSVTSEGFQLSGTLLGPDFATALREAVDAAPDPLLAVDPPSQETADRAATSPVTSEDSPASDESEGLSPVALGVLGGGGGLAALGALTTVGGTVAFVVAYNTLFDAASSGQAKTSMEPVRLVGAGLGVAGVLIFVGGLAVAGSSVAFF